MINLGTPMHRAEVLRSEWRSVSRRMDRRDGFYVRVPAPKSASVVYSSVEMTADDRSVAVLQGDDLIESFSEHVASMPTGCGNISSSQAWSMNRLRKSSSYERVGVAGMSAVAGAKALRERGLRSDHTRQVRLRRSVEVAYGVPLGQGDDRGLALTILGIDEDRNDKRPTALAAKSDYGWPKQS